MSKRSRLQRKASKVVLDEREAQLEQRLREARAERDKRLNQAANEYRKNLEQITRDRAEARKAAQEKYEATRLEVLKEVYPPEAKAA